METGKALEIVHEMATRFYRPGMEIVSTPSVSAVDQKSALDTMEDFIVNNFADEPGGEKEEDLPAPDDNEAAEFQVTASVKFEYDFTETVKKLVADEEEPISEDTVRVIVYGELEELHPGTDPGNITVHVQNVQELETAETYRVVRFHRDLNQDRQVIKKGLTREEAQAHCTDPSSQAPDGSWFDGFEKE